MFRGILSVSVMLLMGLGVVSSNLVQAAAKEDAKAASEKAKPKAKAKARPNAKAKKAANKETRLPGFYREVLTDEQRPQVADVFAKYNGKLARLKAEIKSLTAERDQAVEALLSDSQKARLAQLKADAKSKRAQRPPK